LSFTLATRAINSVSEIALRKWSSQPLARAVDPGASSTHPRNAPLLTGASRAEANASLLTEQIPGAGILSKSLSMFKDSKSVLPDTSKRLALLHRLLKKGGMNVSGTQITPRDRSTHAPSLSYAQQRLWFLNQLEPDSSFYNIAAAIYLSGRLDVRALERALGEILERHEVLRTTFPAINGQPFQLIASPRPFILPVIDLSQFPDAEQDGRGRTLASVEARQPFDLAQGPLLRASVIRMGEQEHVLLLNAHHIVFDGRSIVIFFRELEILYTAFSKGQPSPLAALKLHYADYAAWQRDWLQGEVLERQIAYWKQQLDGAPQILELSTGSAPSEAQSSRGAHLKFTLESELSESLRALSRREGVTLFMTLLASWMLLLSYYSGLEDIVVGTDVANRGHVELEELIGFFANQLVLRTNISGRDSFRGLLKRVRATTLGAYAHQDLPFEQLVKELKPKRVAGRSPLFQVKFVLVSEPAPPPELPGLEVKPVGVELSAAKFDLLLSMTDSREELSGSLEYNTDLMEAVRVTRIAEDFRMLLNHLVREPDATLQQLKEHLEKENGRRRMKKEAQVKESRHQRLRNVKPKSIRAVRHG
jgi:Condensation domain